MARDPEGIMKGWKRGEEGLKGGSNGDGASLWCEDGNRVVAMETVGTDEEARVEMVGGVGVGGASE